MNGELKYTTFETAMGWLGLLASADGLRQTTLPQHSAEEAIRLLGVKQHQASSDTSLFQDLVKRLSIYFRGGQASFPDRLDLSATTPFQRAVWQATGTIPYGETRSYRWVAERIEKPGAARAVGQALGRNPVPVIVPCHRVVASDGKLGGFTGDLELKKRLLQLENSENK